MVALKNIDQRRRLGNVAERVAFAQFGDAINVRGRSMLDPLRLSRSDDAKPHGAGDQVAQGQEQE